MRLLPYGSCRDLLKDVFERDRATSVGPLLEAAERRIEFLPRELNTSLGARTRKCVSARVLAERKRHAYADVARIHDLVRPLVLQHPVLMDAGLVRERVCPDDSLVRLHEVARPRRYELRGGGDLLRVDSRLDLELVAADVQRHHDLLK